MVYGLCILRGFPAEGASNSDSFSVVIRTSSPQGRSEEFVSDEDKTGDGGSGTEVLQ